MSFADFFEMVELLRLCSLPSLFASRSLDSFAFRVVSYGRWVRPERMVVGILELTLILLGEGGSTENDVQIVADCGWELSGVPALVCCCVES